MGWSMPDGREVFTLSEFIANLDLKRVDPAGPVFDLQKLEWLDGEWIRSFSDQDLAKRLKEYTKTDLREIERVLPLVKERLKKLSEFDQLTSYFFQGEIDLDKKQVIPKSKNSSGTIAMLEDVEKALSSKKDWREEEIEAALNAKPDELSWSKTDLFQTIRYIETGTKATPPLFDTLEAIGKEKTISRLQKAIEILSQ